MNNPDNIPVNNVDPRKLEKEELKQVMRGRTISRPGYTAKRRAPKIRRNEICPCCNSGKKFKHCCIDKVQN